MNTTELTATIDGYLKELGTQTLFDGDKIRDMFMDLRLIIMAEASREALVPEMFMLTPEQMEEIKHVPISE